MNAYKGYKFRVVYLEGRGLHLAVDVRTRYVGRISLSEYSAEERSTILSNHLDLDIPFKDRGRFLRDNVVAKFPCRYTGDTGSTVSQYKIDVSSTVLDYYRNNYPELEVNPDDVAIFVKDRDDDRENLSAPASRLFPIFTTEYEGIRRCTVQPQMTPNERFSSIQKFLKYLKGIYFGKTPIKISNQIFIAKRAVFVPSRLEFGKGYILSPFPNGLLLSSSERFDHYIVKWRAKKLPALYQNGPYHNEPLPGMVLIYPKSINRSVRETFIRELRQEIKRQTSQDLQIIQQRQYEIGKGERFGSSLIAVASEIQSTIQRCLTVVILWEKLDKNIHGILKETLRATPSQCAWEWTVRNICNQDNPQRATSQLRNLALGVITEAGVKPWVLADNLHHDLHIGIDLLYGRIGYHFLYGKGGRIIETFFGGAIERGRMYEAIKRPDLRSRLLQSIGSIVKKGYKIQSIIIHRDGRWWQSESDGLKEALRKLVDNRIINKDVRCAVVEVRKNHMPVRLFSCTGDPEGYFKNPLPGTYFLLDSNRILLTTTGRPGAWDEPGGRTASTLLLEVVETIGTLDIEEIAKDAYRLTHLNWNAPDIDISLPVTIRWTDERLRETFYMPMEEEEEEEEPMESEEEKEDKIFFEDET